MDHRFVGPRYTAGVEEEFMIVDPSSLDLVSGINSILGETPPSGEIKPELLESVLEIATSPCPDIATAGAELVALRGIHTESSVSVRSHSAARVSCRRRHSGAAAGVRGEPVLLSTRFRASVGSACRS